MQKGQSPASPEQIEEWKRLMLEAFRETGSVGVSCRRVGISGIRHKRWLQQDPDYRERFDAITIERRDAGLKSGRETGTGRPVGMANTPEAKKRFLAAFAETKWQDAAAEVSGVNISQHHRWMKRDPAYAAQFLSLKESILAAGRKPRKARKRWSEESKQRASGAAKERWERMPEEKRQAHRAVLDKANRHIRGGHHITRLEAKVMTWLTEQDVDYQVHKPIPAGGRTFVADFFVRSANLVVEADGSWWHGEEGAERADERDAAIASVGYRVVRLSEAEIRAGEFGAVGAVIGGEG